MTDEMKLTEAMRSVVRAHAVLADFHREVAAFFEIVDDLLAPEDGQVRLEPTASQGMSPHTIVLSLQTKLTSAAEWVPTWLGRFYRDADAHDEDGGEAVSFEKLAMAFVWVVSEPDSKHLPGLTMPECIAGVAHPGTGGKAVNHWDGARYGVWEALPTQQLVATDWKEGVFPEMTYKFGKGGFWRAKRMPLIELTTRDAIRSKLGEPLLREFASKFGATSRQTTQDE